ncbi:hypothetical protein N7539_008001 [Penicillium diatomitis]|uniref:Uncharacterized protein n=1 Tax=Penicillium diatomitis TaxID=2819901 RepID=A0A9W9WUG9_9EURO|nr:uncharacterized protein N7539_008001 [Penicillium diatomitis]KAJ5475714.1 hypothetical protein N7539_008001 [Penicillium diatomitis]
MEYYARIGRKQAREGEWLLTLAAGSLDLPSMSSLVAQLQVVQSLDRPKMHVIANAIRDSFVFVHGLNPRGRNDHPFQTWTHANGKFWPKDFLAEDIPYARIFVYGYNSSVTNPQSMSTASIKDHANTLLNLLDMERSSQMALLNAKEDPKYGAIRVSTSGLVFFGTPHRGAKAVELGKIAARVARFVSTGHASNDLLNCLEHNSLFTRQMSDRFRHQLEDYRVVSFIEGKEVLLGGVGPTSVSHLVVDEESAVLGLSGLRETQLKLDADHSQMCKVGSRGPMYRLIAGNIKQLVDQALLHEHGFIPQPSPVPQTGNGGPPPLPPRMHFNSSAPYSPPPGRTIESAPKIIGELYTPLDKDPRSIKSAQLKNAEKWDEARNVDYEVFNEHLRSLGADHASTLTVGYQLAEIEFQANYFQKATEWCQWVMDNARRVFGNQHALPIRAESLMSEIVCQSGKYQEAESIAANVLARQQMSIGEDHLDTLQTRRRLAMAYSSLGHQDRAVQASRKVTESLRRLLGDNHILVYWAVLDTLEYATYIQGAEDVSTRLLYSSELKESFQLLAGIYDELRTRLGDRHPVTIRALSLHARALGRSKQTLEASEVYRRGLAICEDTLGPDHPLTMSIVGSIGVMYALQAQRPSYLTTSTPSEAIPWMVRYLGWVEQRRGLEDPETRGSLEILGNLHMAANDYATAQAYFERASAACRGSPDVVMQQRISNNLSLCQSFNSINSLMPSASYGSGLGDFFSQLKKH